MKFTIELENELVPEWSAKYLDYNKGKKKIAAFARALRDVNANSAANAPPKRTTLSNFASLPNLALPRNQDLDRIRNEAQTDGPANAPQGLPPGAEGTRDNELSRPISISRQKFDDPERQPLIRDSSAQDSTIARSRYGSIVGSPVDPPNWGKPKGSSVQFELPGSPPQASSQSPQDFKPKMKPSPLAKMDNGVAADAGEDNQGNLRVAESNSHPLIKTLLSIRSNVAPSSRELPPEAYHELDSRQNEFFNFLDSELQKIESFYKLKEEQATERLKIIREQLHIMRDCHIDELVQAKTNSIRTRSDGSAQLGDDTKGNGKSVGRSWLDVVDSALETARHGGFGTNTQAIDHAGHSTGHEIPYRTAKVKLKAAMQEFYRGLELLKSYALLNRKAFRKMNKKFDKAANAPPTLQYMSEKVNEAYFVKSHVLGGHIRAVEDLYARYFEGGNYKVATSKLRASTDNINDYNGVVFQNGLMAATGLWFAIAGLRSANLLLYHPNPTLALNTSYLLQIYGGYFLMLFLMLLFCVDCKIWTLYKVNYAFIFEFDSRHHLDWRQLAELPCICLLLFGIFLWLNFSSLGEDDLFLFYPAILIGLTAVLIFLPAPTLFYRSRSWFLYSSWRLVLSGVYPVEFRDFFMGDMFCSLTYSIGNIELFFCLYGHDWGNPDSCNSSHSRILGVLSTLPGIWRSLQCLRRYWDTGNKFPHLANCLKYSFTVSYYVSLSMYRLNKTNELFAVFIAFATANAFYCSVWDLVMDWSLLDPFASRKFLRDTLVFKPVWIYYAAMIIDPILRFNWIFYAIYTNDTKHSAIISFLIALSEIFRRGVWTIFRVENEHCTNVGHGRASRDFPLPYHIEHQAPEGRVEQGYPVSGTREDSDLHEEHKRQGIIPPRLARMISFTPGASFLGMHTDHHEPSPTTIRRKKRLEANPLLQRLGDILHTAHAQDFERKKKPGTDDLKHTKDEEEEDVMDINGSKVDDAKVEVAKRVAEAVAERAAKEAEEAEEEEEALQEFAIKGGRKVGESSSMMEERLIRRLRNLDEDAGHLSEDNEAESSGNGGAQKKDSRS